MTRTHGMPVLERLLLRRRVIDGCWVWQGSRDAKGYGKITLDRPRLVHRVAWEVFRGDLPIRSWVLHQCDNPPCFNPDHLFLGSPLTNVRDCISKGRDGGTGRRNREKVACAKGHAFDAANTYVDPRGWRQCRACARERNHSYKQRLRWWRARNRSGAVPGGDG